MRVVVSKSHEHWRLYVHDRAVSSHVDRAAAERAAARIVAALRSCDLPVTYSVDEASLERPCRSDPAVRLGASGPHLRRGDSS
jgi:hypothetical protein